MPNIWFNQFKKLKIGLLNRSDVEIEVHPGILMHRRILSLQKDLAQFLRACPEIKRIPESKK